jgi:beta-galactosidase/beta-glucuronidase
MSWKPVPGNIMTRWAKGVTPDNAWKEYPRPQMVRSKWVNLNGLWKYGICSRDEEYSEVVEGEILVPFPIESALSGVKRALEPGEKLFYRRDFSIPKEWIGKRILLHFGAVDWEATVWINGQKLGTHQGGYIPFQFDITDLITRKQNELVVAAWDPTDKHWQQRGKQVHKPKTIWYTAVSGIWQTVWLEPVPQTYIVNLKIEPDVDNGTVSINVNMAGVQTKMESVCIQVLDEGALVAFTETKKGEMEAKVSIPDPKLWSPESPYLYDLEVIAGEDKVSSYFGMRKVSIENGRLSLNNRPYFMFGPLDQGYWPDGLYTAPSDEAMQYDIKLVKELGFNMLRKHVKVEPARYYYYCDKMGLIVWQDMVSGGRVQSEREAIWALVFNPKRRNDRAYQRFGREAAESRDNFRQELGEMVESLFNFPSIGVWVPFNEGWGQFDAKTVGEWVRTIDPTRPVDHASGWFDQGGGDFTSRHIYNLKLKPIPPVGDRAMALTEFGGYSMKVDGHLWNPSAEFGYQKFSNPESLTKAYISLIDNQLMPWINAGLSAAIYTQTTDVEIEVNGFMTYDREIEKMDFRKLRELHYGIQKRCNNL